jgi:hypothetical protein
MTFYWQISDAFTEKTANLEFLFRFKFPSFLQVTRSDDFKGMLSTTLSRAYTPASICCLRLQSHRPCGVNWIPRKSETALAFSNEWNWKPKWQSWCLWSIPSFVTDFAMEHIGWDVTPVLFPFDNLQVPLFWSCGIGSEPPQLCTNPWPKIESVRQWDSNGPNHTYWCNSVLLHHISQRIQWLNDSRNHSLLEMFGVEPHPNIFHY